MELQPGTSPKDKDESDPVSNEELRGGGNRQPDLHPTVKVKVSAKYEDQSDLGIGKALDEKYNTIFPPWQGPRIWATVSTAGANG